MMRKFIASVLLMLMTFVLVGTLMTRPARADIVVFTAVLSAANEVAPVGAHPTESAASGIATVTLDVTRSGTTITAATASFDVTISGLASNSVIILAHIHEGGSAVNGPVRVDSGLSPGVPVVPSGGGASFTRSGLTVSPATAQGIISNPAGWYFNVHTALSPGGVARGQLAAQQGPIGGGAPTLSEWGAILMTLLFVAVCTFFLLGRGKTALAFAGAEQASLRSRPVRAIDWKLLAMAALIVEVAVGLGLVALRADAVDAVGALISGLVIAFTIHLFVANARGR